MEEVTFSFEKLKVCQAARALVKDVYVLQNSFPKEEKYALGDIRFHKSTDMANTFHVDDILNDGRAHCNYSTTTGYDENVEERLLDMLKKVLMMVAK